MRKIIVVLALLATPAFAADLPYKSAPPMNAAVYQQSSWTGFYLGINGGGGWALSDQGVPGFGSVSTTGSGGVIGGTFGYNYQLNNNFVLGLETDLDWANIGGSGAVGPVTGASQTLNWIGTARARAGLLVTPSTLVFATGGFAYGGANSSTAVVGASVSSTSTQVGWVIGAGLEQRLLQSWSAKVEYNYVDLGSIDNVLNTVGINQNLHYQIVKAGLNYHF